MAAQFTPMNARSARLDRLWMASYQFLASAGFAQNQNGGVGSGHLVDLAKHLTERFRRANDVLEHRITIDLLS
jgi:hypothetical protein